WRHYLKERSRPDDPMFGPWHDLMALPEPDFAAGASTVRARWQDRPAGTQPGQLNPMVAETLANATLRSKADVARTYGELIRRVDTEARKSAPAISAAPEDAARR